MNEGIKITGNWVDEMQTEGVRLQVLLFKEDNIHYAYVPALDIYGYGLSEVEAWKSMETTLSEFFNYVLEKNSFVNELNRLGWKKVNDRLLVPFISDQLSSNEMLRNIINNKQFTSTTLEVEMPAID